jgi:hypothetical protein
MGLAGDARALPQGGEARAQGHEPSCRADFDLGEHSTDVFLTMEYIEGRSLAPLLDATPVGVDEAMRIACAVCGGIAAVHARQRAARQSRPHRDHRPRNEAIVAAVTEAPR